MVEGALLRAPREAAQRLAAEQRLQTS